MAFTLQPAVGEFFVDRKAILEEMVSTLSAEDLLTQRLERAQRVGG